MAWMKIMDQILMNTTGMRSSSSTTLATFATDWVICHQNFFGTQKFTILLKLFGKVNFLFIFLFLLPCHGFSQTQNIRVKFGNLRRTKKFARNYLLMRIISIHNESRCNHLQSYTVSLFWSCSITLGTIIWSVSVQRRGQGTASNVSIAASESCQDLLNLEEDEMTMGDLEWDKDLSCCTYYWKWWYFLC